VGLADFRRDDVPLVRGHADRGRQAQVRAVLQPVQSHPAQGIRDRRFRGRVFHRGLYGRPAEHHGAALLGGDRSTARRVIHRVGRLGRGGRHRPGARLAQEGAQRSSGTAGKVRPHRDGLGIAADRRHRPDRGALRRANPEWIERAVVLGRRGFTRRARSPWLELVRRSRECVGRIARDPRGDSHPRRQRALAHQRGSGRERVKVSREVSCMGQTREERSAPLAFEMIRRARYNAHV